MSLYEFSSFYIVLRIFTYFYVFLHVFTCFYGFFICVSILFFFKKNQFRTCPEEIANHSDWIMFGLDIHSTCVGLIMLGKSAVTSQSASNLYEVMWRCVD